MNQKRWVRVNPCPKCGRHGTAEYNEQIDWLKCWHAECNTSAGSYSDWIALYPDGPSP